MAFMRNSFHHGDTEPLSKTKSASSAMFLIGIAADENELTEASICHVLGFTGENLNRMR
jgi:hypothetical protein